MTVYLEKFKVVFPGHRLDGNTLDFIIKNGKFDKIGKNLKPPKSSEIISKGYISPGWVDVGTHLTAPGHEERDTVTSLLNTAAAGGFTEIVTLPNTEPAIHDGSAIRSIIALAEGHTVTLHPLGAASIGSNSSTLVEMHDMKDAGAVGFSDGENSIIDEGKLYRTLQYAKGVDSLIVNQAKVNSLADNWQMNEGKVNVTLGLIGQPSLVEDIATARDLEVNKYASSKLLFHKLSSPEAIKSVAKASNINKVYSSVNYLNLVLNDEVLADFDSNFKVDPPLRSQPTLIKLVKLINSGKVDLIISDHCPLDQESKLVEFDQAKFGALGLQTFYPAINTYAREIDLATFVKCIAINARRIFNIPLPEFAEGELANITLFDPKQEFTLNHDTNKSKSQNSPFWEKPLQGRILGIFANGSYIDNN